MAEISDPTMELRELRQRLQLLELENDRLAERAEDTYLLGVIAEKINRLPTVEAVLETGFAQISLLMEIPFCAYGWRDEGELRILHSFSSLTHETLPDLRFPLPPELDEEGMLLLDAQAIGASAHLPFAPVAALLIPFPVRANPAGVFFFAVAVPATRLAALHPLLRRAVGILVSRIDLLSLLHELQEVNRTLDRKVEERTRDLRVAHDALAHESSELAQALEALGASERRFRTIFAIAGVGIVVADRKRRILDGNPAFLAMLGYELAEVVGRKISELQLPEEQEADCRPVAGNREQDHPFSGIMEKRYRRKDGSILSALLSVSMIPVSAGGEEAFIDIIEDISAQKQTVNEHQRLQEQLNQAQKMESVGRLAGGVAHDFNNILSVILGYTDLSLRSAEPGGKLQSNLEEIRAAALRSAALTRQLLAFARKQTVTPQVMDINVAVEATFKMLQRLISEDIKLHWRPAPELWPVKIDPTQVDQILANLCVNARDAMPGGGQVTIATENAVLDEEYCARHLDATPGEYVRLTVRDSGCGMAKEVLDHLFEPFYTTKPLGQGTGLGLATIYGIVKQNQGVIEVVSAPGRGSTFTIFLPRHRVSLLPPPEEAKECARPVGHETILVVEDELVLLNISRIMLQEMGYRVLSAASPSEAIRLAEKHGAAIQLLMTDVVMPEMNGRELSRRLLALNPDLKCLFISGYTADVIVDLGVLDEGIQFLEKPFSFASLAKKVRETLDCP